jgi:hypothetical protein
VYRPLVLRWRKSGAAATGVKNDDFEVDDVDSRRNFVEVPVGVGEDGGGGDWARGVVECERCSSNSTSRGVMGLGIPGT